MNNSPRNYSVDVWRECDLDTQAQQDFVAAIQLLKNDALRTFRIEIETDSTIAVNENVEKQSRIEFLSAISQFLPQALSTFQQILQLGQAMAEMLFGVRGFRAGRLESAIEQGIDQIPTSGGTATAAASNATDAADAKPRAAATRPADG